MKQSLFDAIDYDGSGALSRAEVAQLLVDQGITVEENYLDGVLDAYDLDQSGEIDLGMLPPTGRIPTVSESFTGLDILSQPFAR